MTKWDRVTGSPRPMSQMITYLKYDAANGCDLRRGRGWGNEHSESDWQAWTIEDVTPPGAVVVGKLGILETQVILTFTPITHDPHSASHRLPNLQHETKL